MKALLYLFVCCALQHAASAQSSSVDNKPSVVVSNEREPKVDKSRLRDLKGIAKDETGQPLDGVIIQLKDLRTGKIVDFRTKDDGRYLFYDLNMDQNYELRVMKDGFASPPMKKLTKYDPRKPAIINFELERKKAS